MRISLILPFLNEEAILESALDDLRKTIAESAEPERIEVILSDSGSKDRSFAIANDVAESAGWRVVSEPFPHGPSIGRCVQQGARHASGELILVCPVDVSLTSRALSDVLSLREPTCGGFLKAYDDGSRLAVAYQWVLNRLRTSWMHHLVWTNCIFFPRELATAIPTHGFLEDVGFSDASRTHREFRILPGPVAVSFRRYRKDGAITRILLNLLVMSLFRMRLCRPEKLRRLYQLSVHQLIKRRYFRERILESYSSEPSARNKLQLRASSSFWK